MLVKLYNGVSQEALKGLREMNLSSSSSFSIGSDPNASNWSQLPTQSYTPGM
ncbi:hypothetical protein GUITHDRAFT_154864 [Guillardia theta CCMP2712]|uniref:Uncharacterized protein n=1 Tax=Guillardia theta (strain CCMP2712) TaxID=905079 RepID=L1INL8_GUITC|nr:hypothetical protein GUITHDRAFT_154864 [Guillardia theta CCMP2712]EKX37881.1 hypothetical protein GUITHDRAFT_154864 [Guillardia theta CCMP2712]|eukprot:XP_005824861.1 hypothetical protein GUITHDRAFT_154864 [Guillardia theta CCMP2712]